jgi:transcription termination factor NusB
MVSSAIDPKKARRLASLLSSRPSKELERFATTQKQLEALKALKNCNQYTARCMLARVGALRIDDPIKKLKKGDAADKALYDLIWREVYMYEALWGVVQIGFEYVKDEIEKLEIAFPFACSFDLFLEIVSVSRNNDFLDYLKQSHEFNIPKIKKTFQTAERLARATNISPGRADDQASLKALTKEQLPNFWLELTYSICERHAKQDELIRERLTDWKRQVARIFQQLFSDLERSRKGRFPIRFYSHHVIEGQEVRHRKALS